MKSNIKWIIIFSLLCAVSAAWWFFFPRLKTDRPTAVIRQGNTVIKTIDLSDVNEPYEFKITDDNGGHNTIRVEKGRIGVIDADCPDKVCVNRGFIGSSAVPIVCLPHRLSVSITGKDAEFDAAAGGN